MRVLTLAQAAARLGLSPSTLRNQVYAGRLRATLVGKAYVITERELARYQAQSQGRTGRPRRQPDHPASS